MQFYIIHHDPETNARLLPDYAIKQVNVREGWQILSDIGHNLGIEFPGQNKAYSIWHAETRRFMKDHVTFGHFVACYRDCLSEYTNRFRRRTIFHDRYDQFIGDPYLSISMALPTERTHEQFMASYLLRGKRDKLTVEEIARLEELL